ncbi:MAG: hypothetical protein JNL98_09600 [Bryobacterales bacterium]|nr:hypothetical protein [Bryobacterales bacterium]
MRAMPYPFMIRQAVIAATANALINGGKAWWSLGQQTGLPLTLDSISGGSGTVLGKAVAGAFGLALAATAVTFLTFRSAARKKGVPLVENLRFWPKYPFLMLKNAIFLFGMLVMLAVLFHKRFGEIAVSGAAASVITGGLAFAVCIYTALATMNEMVAKRK